jgi:hypothetical protein
MYMEGGVRLKGWSIHVHNTYTHTTEMTATEDEVLEKAFSIRK